MKIVIQLISGKEFAAEITDVVQKDYGSITIWEHRTETEYLLENPFGLTDCLRITGDYRIHPAHK